MKPDRYLLDTDTCVEILRGNEKVILRRRNIQDPVVTTEITASELYFGAAKSREPQRNKSLVDDFLASVAVMPISLLGSKFFGALKAHLERQGNPIPDADLWIASIARSLRMKIVTGNGKHFDRVPNVITEDWIRGSQTGG